MPIPGTRSSERLDENIGALNVHLSASELETINSLIPFNAAIGEQYPDAFNFEI